MRQVYRHQQHLLLWIFVLSGFAGLIYQSIWSHYLGLFLGHAAYAQALVLAIFMGGMAVGAGWVARAGEKWRNLIRSYALIEGVIGALGLAFHLVFIGLIGVSYDVLIPAIGNPWAVNAFRWSVAAVLILPQTILLGMTFPLMSGGLIRRFPGADGSLLGGLYFTNSIGAAVGALVAVFVLLPRVGLPGAMVFAAGTNLLVAAIAWSVARGGEPAPREEVVVRSEVEASGRRAVLRVVLIGTALSGAASFAYEIVWIRMLSLAVGTTIHAFELMLASFIAGIAFGGLWIRRRADLTPEPLRLVGWMQICMGLAALASLVFYANSFEWVGWMMQALARSDGGYVLFNFGTAAVAILIMLPAAFFAGTTLPLFTVALLGNGHGERSIGRVYAWNTVGAIAGVFAAIHFLIPILGLKLALISAALVDMAIGLALLRWHVDSRRAMLRFAAVGAAVVISIGMAITLVKFDPVQLASGVFRSGNSQVAAEDRILFYRDGKTASVSAMASPDGTVRIATNGKVDAAIAVANSTSSQLDEPTMALLAALPLGIHPAPNKVGVIGFGSGMTTHTLLADPRVKAVDTVEIEQAMIDGARVFGNRVARAYDDPRSNIVIDDAKAYFAGQKVGYDIIISEPSNPWISGIGALFSKEFYEFIPRHLNDDGLFVQWIQLYEIDESLVSSILNALTPAFDDYAAWLTNHSDLLIIAAPNGKLPDVDLERMLAGDLGADLARVGFTDPGQLSYRKVADAALLRAIGRLHGGVPNSDYNPILSLQAPKTRFRNENASSILSLPFNGQLLEALGVRPPLLNGIALSKLRHFPAELMTRDARILAAVLSGDAYSDIDLTGASLSTLEAALVFKELTRECQGPWTQGKLKQALVSLDDLGRRTIPFLPASALEGVWIRPAWRECEEMPDVFVAALDIFAAMSERDYRAVSIVGRDWLGKSAGEATVAEFNSQVLSAVLLAHAHEGNWEEMLAVEKTLGRDVRSAGNDGQLRQLLLALADEKVVRP